ncbi:MAG: EamA family transporter [Acidimicrobiales bacterium]|jgi:drug/metabolite transporter (DMT)-like permease
MALSAFFLALAAAVLHAGWNSMVKASPDRLISVLAVSVGSMVGTIPILLIYGLPERPAWWYVAVSSCVHTVYFLCLAAAYERSDFSLAYPVARGVAPAIAGVAGVVLLDDVLSALGVIGIVLVSLGIGSLVRITADGASGLKWALATGGCIAAYTVIDGAGVRAGEESLGYVAAVLLLSALLVTFVVLMQRPLGVVVEELRRGYVAAVGAGLTSVLAYLLVLVAARKAPIGLVSGVRETSVIFGLIIAWLVFRERISRSHVAAVLVTAAGALCIAVS